MIHFKHFLSADSNAGFIPGYIFKNYKNDLAALIVKKKKFFQNKFEIYKNDVKKTWSNLRDISGYKAFNKCNNITLTDHNNVAIRD